MAKKILMIDDEPDIIRLIESRLKAHGYEVITARDGQEGLDKARKEKPDLIILDVAMPKINGYQVCHILKSDMQYNSIPIVMLTACGQAMDIQKGMEKGADSYISKPFEPNMLLGIIDGLVGE